MWSPNGKVWSPEIKRNMEFKILHLIGLCSFTTISAEIVKMHAQKVQR